MMWRTAGKKGGWHYANSPLDCKIAHNRQPGSAGLFAMTDHCWQLLQATIAGMPERQPHRQLKNCDP
jgi:hypothetical protein